MLKRKRWKPLRFSQMSYIQYPNLVKGFILIQYQLSTLAKIRRRTERLKRHADLSSMSSRCSCLFRQVPLFEIRTRLERIDLFSLCTSANTTGVRVSTPTLKLWYGIPVSAICRSQSFPNWGLQTLKGEKKKNQEII